ncbi:MarR family winged helix-turn-helix transcriptional regulator [Thalassococcus sp. S3]|uniref:MarR family winged helix-turn-helix transcriptional regulator n=1 Tax=Thalassococcus sp. S3 TaxID=2017482 RepID=UPI001024580A|nr:MarR family winged helix-turn-helix transcriptional regulator [Thalassococcus sp. S3]QBF32583.1 hypothetical protein CFI11_15355 [Thalassococcus sp. S3]
MDSDAENRQTDAIETLTFRFIKLGNKIAASFSDYGNKHGIILSEWRCIIWLAAMPGSSGQDTAHGTAMDRMNVSRNLRSLEKKGLVTRRADDQDAKRWLWELTRAGRDIYEAIMPYAAKRDRRITEAFTAAELSALNKALTKAMEALD